MKEYTMAIQKTSPINTVNPKEYRLTDNYKKPSKPTPREVLNLKISQISSQIPHNPSQPPKNSSQIPHRIGKKVCYIRIPLSREGRNNKTSSIITLHPLLGAKELWLIKE